MYCNLTVELPLEKEPDLFNGQIIRIKCTYDKHYNYLQKHTTLPNVLITLIKEYMDEVMKVRHYHSILWSSKKTELSNVIKSEDVYINFEKVNFKIIYTYSEIYYKQTDVHKIEVSDNIISTTTDILNDYIQLYSHTSCKIVPNTKYIVNNPITVHVFSNIVNTMHKFMNQLA